jgi:hypothetical protein
MPACPGSSMAAPPALRRASSRSKIALRPAATNHGVLPRGLPQLKRVIAVGRDQIGQSAGVVYVNGMVATEALDHDREGRPLPFWQGCARIREGQITVLAIVSIVLVATLAVPTNATCCGSSANVPAGSTWRPRGQISHSVPPQHAGRSAIRNP